MAPGEAHLQLTDDNYPTLDVSFSESGELLFTEKGMNVTDLPPAVTKTVRKSYRGAPITSVEKVTEKGSTQCQVGLRNAPGKEQLYTADAITAHEQ